MSKKKKNKINTEQALLMFRVGYDLKVKEFNFYQFRISSEYNPFVFYDWYHTTGSLVRNRQGICKSMGKYPDAEDAAIFIKKDLESLIIIE